MNKAREQFLLYWVEIVLSVVSIIQGLAFNDLVSRFPKILDHALATGESVGLVHFALSFVILLRVFQTYIVAALDYTDWNASFIDVFLIFVIGGIEYYVFSSLALTPVFDVQRYHRHLSVLSIFGILGYIAALLRIKEEMVGSYEKYKVEVRVQSYNVCGLIVVQAISTIIFLSPRQASSMYAALGCVCIGVLIFNIYYSLSRSFANTPVLATQGTAIESVANPGEAHDTVQVVIRNAGRQDLVAIMQMLMMHYSMKYSMLFDTSVRITRELLKRALLISRGNHFLGYNNFFLASDCEDGRCVGILSFSPHLKTSAIQRSFAGLLLCVLVVRFLGVVGVVRYIRSLRAMRRSESRVAPDELHIRIIAVDPTLINKGIGSQLLDYAYVSALTSGRKRLVVDVPSGSHALKFFERRGFSLRLRRNAISTLDLQPVELYVLEKQVINRRSDPH